MSGPPRLLEAEAVLPRELTRALDAAGGEPSPLELEQLASRLSVALGVPLGVPAAASSSSSSSSSSSAPASSASAAAAVVTGAGAKPLVSLGAWVLGGVLLGVGLSGVGAYTFAAFDMAKPSGSSQADARVTKPTAQPPAAARPEPDSVASASVGPAGSASGAARPSESPRAVSTTAPAAEEAVALEPQETELSLLHRAQQSINTNPSRALALVALHDRSFPDGLLAQEREVIAIDALTRLGRFQDAQARAWRFSERYPGSAHAPRLRALLQGSEAR